MPSTNLEFLFIIFIGITGFAVLLQAGVLLAMFLTMRKAINTAKERTEGLEGKLIPVLENAHEFLAIGKELIASAKVLMAKIDPRLQSTAAELEAVSKDVHAQATRLQAFLDEVTQKARHQTDRVDGMTTSFLNGLDRFGRFVNQTLEVPVRQVSGVVAAARAVVETLRTPAPPRSRSASQAAPASSQPAYETDDKDLVV